MAPLIVCNWKMNYSPKAGSDFANSLKTTIPVNHQEVLWIAPTQLAYQSVKETLSTTQIKVGAQNCHWKSSGAYTGEVSATMLKDSGADFVIVGHSERRQHFGETNDTAVKRALAAISSGLTAILCIGESEASHAAGETATVLLEQLSPLAGESALHSDAAKLIIAYEPIWAIGTGNNATISDIKNAHQTIIDFLHQIGVTTPQVLYGGSVTPDNLAGILNIKRILVAGVLVGGASLDLSKVAAMCSLASNPI